MSFRRVRRASLLLRVRHLRRGARGTREHGSDGDSQFPAIHTH